MRRNEVLAREAGKQDSILEAINSVGVSIDSKFDATVHALGDMRDEVKRLADRPIIAPLASKPADQPPKPPLSKEEKEEQMYKRILWGVIAFLLLVGAAYAAITIYPPGTKNTTTDKPKEPPAHQCTWLNPKDCPPYVIAPPATPKVTPLAPPMEPKPIVSSVAGEPDSPINRMIEMKEGCPAIDLSNLGAILAQDSFEDYKIYLPQYCGGGLTALVKAPVVIAPPSDEPGLPPDSSDQTSCPEGTEPVHDDLTDIWLCQDPQQAEEQRAEMNLL